MRERALSPELHSHLISTIAEQAGADDFAQFSFWVADDLDPAGLADEELLAQEEADAAEGDIAGGDLVGGVGARAVEDGEGGFGLKCATRVAAALAPQVLAGRRGNDRRGRCGGGHVGFYRRMLSELFNFRGTRRVDRGRRRAMSGGFAKRQACWHNARPAKDGAEGNGCGARFGLFNWQGC